MRRIAAIFTITSLMVALAGFAGCSQAPAQVAATHLPFYVPATIIVQSPESVSAADAAISPLAFQVLASSDYEQSYFPRGQKFVYGDIPIAQYSSYSVLFYDVQRIPTPYGTGSRYVWDVKSGINIH